MLAVCTTASLVLLDPSTLKKAPSSVPPTLAFSNTPTASSWAPDNSVLFVAHESAIHRYNSAGTSLGTVSIAPTGHPITSLASKDKGDTVIFSDADGITVLDANTGKVAFRLDTHTGPVSGLALAHDAPHLASVSRAGAGGVSEVHVHNLSIASHVELQGFPKAGEVTACMFHMHMKSKLLLAIGTQLLVYDVTKPSAPVRAIQLDKRSGEAVSITCSPFSKTLIAVGCSSGVVNLVDLEKEKGLFRTLPLEARLTSLVFSPEGAALYAGTDDGRVLVLDLRALDKPPRPINVSTESESIVCMSVQRKLKPGEIPRTGSKSAATLGKRAGAEPPSPANKLPRPGPSAIPSPPSVPLLKPKSPSVSRKSLSPGPLLGRTVRTRTISATSSTPSKPAVKTKIDPSKSTPPTPKMRTVSIAPPERDIAPPPIRVRTVSAATSASSRVTSGTSSVGSRISRVSSSTSATSVGMVSPSTRKVSGGTTKSVARPKPSPSVSDDDTNDVPTERPFPTTKRATASSAQEKPARQLNPRQRTISTTSTRSTSTRAVPVPGEGRGGTSSAAPNPSPRSTAATARSRAASARSSANNAQPRPRPHSRNSPSISPIPPVPTLPAAFREEQLTEINIRLRTPSPELPGDEAAYTPMPMRRRDKGKGKEQARPKTNVLGLGTPELKKWIQSEAAQAEEDDGPERRKVEFLAVPPNELQIQSIQVVDEDGQPRGDHAGGGSGDAGKATIQMTVQISPRRAPANLSPNWAPIPSLFSPSRNVPNNGQTRDQDGSSSSTQPSVNPAHELLQSLIRDAMYDFRRETKAEIIGLHLDLVRTGRGWRKEMREALDKWGEELNEIRKENELLRQENERLRRGY